MVNAGKYTVLVFMDPKGIGSVKPWKFPGIRLQKTKDKPRWNGMVFTKLFLIELIPIDVNHEGFRADLMYH